MSEITGMCMHCKKIRTMINPVATRTKLGAPAKMGICQICGNKMFRMGGGNSPRLTEIHHLIKQ